MLRSRGNVNAMPKGERKCQKREANDDFKFKEFWSLASGQRQTLTRREASKWVLSADSYQTASKLTSALHFLSSQNISLFSQLPRKAKLVKCTTVLLFITTTTYCVTGFNFPEDFCLEWMHIYVTSNAFSLYIAATTLCRHFNLIPGGQNHYCGLLLCCIHTGWLYMYTACNTHCAGAQQTWNLKRALKRVDKFAYNYRHLDQLC